MKHQFNLRSKEVLTFAISGGWREDERDDFSVFLYCRTNKMLPSCKKQSAARSIIKGFYVKMHLQRLIWRNIKTCRWRNLEKKKCLPWSYFCVELKAIIIYLNIFNSCTHWMHESQPWIWARSTCCPPPCPALGPCGARLLGPPTDLAAAAVVASNNNYGPDWHQLCWKTSFPTNIKLTDLLINIMYLILN